MADPEPETETFKTRALVQDSLLLPPISKVRTLSHSPQPFLSPLPPPSPVPCPYPRVSHIFLVCIRSLSPLDLHLDLTPHSGPPARPVPPARFNLCSHRNARPRTCPARAPSTPAALPDDAVCACVCVCPPYRVMSVSAVCPRRPRSRSLTVSLFLPPSLLPFPFLPNPHPHYPSSIIQYP